MMFWPSWLPRQAPTYTGSETSAPGATTNQMDFLKAIELWKDRCFKAERREEKWRQRALEAECRIEEMLAK